MIAISVIILCLGIISSLIFYFLKIVKLTEIAIPLLVTTFPAILVTSAIWFGVRNSMVSYKEYWNNKIINVNYYESWNQRVSCRHPIYRTETYTDSKGHIHSREVLVGYMHPYDVDEHPPYWEGVLDSNDVISISEPDYGLYKNLWGNNTFIDLHRNYHTKNGNEYTSAWNNQIVTIFPYATIHTYKNKVRASNSIFNYSKKDIPEDMKKMFQRPVDVGTFDVFFNYGVEVSTASENDYLRKINALLGREKEIHCMVFLFSADKYDQTIMNDIRYIWNGPNKNELDIFIGINKDKEVVWCDAMSWCDDTTIHSQIRQAIFELKKYNGMKVVDIIKDMVPKYWSRKHFRDFEYLSVDVPTWVSVLCISLAVVWDIACTFIVPVIIEGIEEKRKNRGYDCQY